MLITYSYGQPRPQGAFPSSPPKPGKRALGTRLLITYSYGQPRPQGAFPSSPPKPGKSALGTRLLITYVRELKQQRRRRLQKRHLKSELAPIQTLSRLFHPVYFVKCWQMFLELNSKGLYQSSGKEKKVVVLCPRPRQNMNSGIFTL